MRRTLVDRFDRPDLDDPAEIHHDDPVAEILHDVEVVADEDVCRFELVLEIEQEVQDLRLDRFAEGGDRLVEDQEAGSTRARERC